MLLKFYNREQEIKKLMQDIQNSKKCLYLTVCKGIRRVGKTKLVKHVVEKTKIKYLYLYVVADKSKGELLKSFQRSAAEVFKQEFSQKNLTEFLEELFKIAQKKHFVLIMDEFQNFIDVDKSIFGELQRLIDEYEDKSKFLIICLGSYVSLIEDIFSNQKAPLYRRAKEKQTINPWKFKYVLQLCLDYQLNFNDALNFYTLFGGMPHYYVLLFDKNLHNFPISKVFEKICLGSLQTEVDQIISTELKKYDKARAVLEAINQGYNICSKITKFVFGQYNLKSQEEKRRYYSDYKLVEKTLKKLKDFQFVTSGNKINSNKNIYKIKNNFIKIYFKYIFKYLDLIEFEEISRVVEYFKKNFEVDKGFTYEAVTRQYLLGGNFQGINFDVVEKIGNKNNEIDLLAWNSSDNIILFLECKYQVKPVDIKVLEKLKKRSLKIKFKEINNKTKKIYVVLSHSDFQQKAKKYGFLNNIQTFNTKEFFKEWETGL